MAKMLFLALHRNGYGGGRDKALRTEALAGTVAEILMISRRSS
ncbi:hypothetical protein ACNKHV_14390 [Shigella flexneri]